MKVPLILIAYELGEVLKEVKKLTQIGNEKKSEVVIIFFIFGKTPESNQFKLNWRLLLWAL